MSTPTRERWESDSLSTHRRSLVFFARLIAAFSGLIVVGRAWGDAPVPRSSVDSEGSGIFVAGEPVTEKVEDGELVRRHNVGVGIGLNLSPYPRYLFLQDIPGSRVCLAIRHWVVSSDLQRIKDLDPRGSLTASVPGAISIHAGPGGGLGTIGAFRHLACGCSA